MSNTVLNTIMTVSHNMKYLYSYELKSSLLFHYIRKEGRKEMFYLTMHSTDFIYGYMASDIW